MTASVGDWGWGQTPLGLAWADGQGLAQLGWVAAAIVLAWCASWLLARGMGAADRRFGVLFGRFHWDGVFVPLIALLSLWLARAVLRAQPMSVTLISLSLQFLLAWLLVAVISRAVLVGLPHQAWVRAAAHWGVWLTWAMWVLWALGVLPVLLDEMDAVVWIVGQHRWTLRTVIEGGFTTAVVLVLALWIASLAESYLLRDVGGADLSLRKMLASALRAALVFVGLVLALGAVGINLTALSVLGGALGVGIGFGLQKLAANYVSGFVVLGERSVRIGDVVRVDGFEGEVSDIRGRYTVLRAPTGIESIVPNEMLITQRVENLSLADSKVWLSTSVTVAYDSDVDLVIRVLQQAAQAQARVLVDPPARAVLESFAADGLNFVLGFWIADPSNGRLNVLSDVNVAALGALRANGIDIPYPQRVLRWLGPAAPTATPSGTGSDGTV